MSGRWRVGTVAALALAAAVAWPAGAQERRGGIAFVNMDRVFTEFHKTQVADAQLRAQAEEFSQERRQMIEEIQAAQETFNTLREESQDVALSEDARERRRREAEEKLLEIREIESRIERFDELRSKQLEDQGRRMRRGLVEEIRDTIRAYARRHQFEAVLDASGQSLNGIEIALYVDPRVDITEALLEILNEDAP